MSIGETEQQINGRLGVEKGRDADTKGGAGAGLARRTFIRLFGAAALAWSIGARAQQRSGVLRIGVLETTPPALNVANFAAFRQGLRALGYIEGQNLNIDYRSADSADGFASLAPDLVRLKVDLMVVRGTPAALAAKHASATIPIVILSIGDPFSVVQSLAHPGGNVTGFSSLVTETESKRVELLKRIVPGATRIAALYNMTNPVFQPRWKQLEEIAHTNGIKPQLLDV